MTHDSSLENSVIDVNPGAVNTPRLSTLDFVRQYARTCIVLEGVALSRMVIN